MVFWVLLVTWLGRKLFSTLGPAQAPREKYPNSPLVPKPLYRDPWCGTHVSPEISYSLEQAGQALHFCSAECRERYLESQRRAANG